MKSADQLTADEQSAILADRYTTIRTSFEAKL